MLPNIFDVATLNKSDMTAAVNNEAFDDLEDSMQHQSSVATNINYIVTRNTKDFKGSTVSAITPEEFLELVHKN